MKIKGWKKGSALNGKKQITDKYLIWRTEDPKPSYKGYNIIVSQYPKFVDVKISKKGYYVVLEKWWLGSTNKLLGEGLIKSRAIKMVYEYMKGHKNKDGAK